MAQQHTKKTTRTSIQYSTIEPLFLLGVSAVILLTMIIILPPVSADPEQYLMSGISRDSTYVQSGTSLWGSLTPVIATRVFTEIESGLPVVADLNSDGINEIYVIADSYLYALRYTTGVGFTIQASAYQGDPDLAGTQFYVTPTTINSSHIATSNLTNFYTFTFNGTALTVDANISTGIGGTAPTLYSNKYVSVKCAPGTQMASGNLTCFMEVNEKTGGTINMTTIVCDLAGETCDHTGAFGVTNSDTTWHNTHLADGDNDGYIEEYQAYNDGGNGDLQIFKVDVSASGVPTKTKIYTDNLAANKLHTDIVVSNMDSNLANGLELTFGFSSDSTNMNAHTISAVDGSEVQTSYCTALSCPEGIMMSYNLVVADDTQYCDYTGDVYYYVSNTYNNDPGLNTDAVHCISLYAGAQTKETTVSNAGVNFTRNPVLHQMMVNGETGLLTHKFMIGGNTKASSALNTNDFAIIPVDYQNSGSLDLIGINATTIRFYDDGYTNANYVISSMGRDTGNPTCQNAVITFNTVTTDAEDDAGDCYLNIAYTNGTQIGNYSAQSFASAPSIVNYYYSADTLGTFFARAFCKDQYHTTYVNRSLTFMVVNTTPCYNTGEGGTNTSFTNATTSTDTSLDDTMDVLFGASTKVKSIAAIGIICGIAVGMGTAGGFALGVIGAALGTVLVTFLGLLSAYILILIIAILVLILLFGKVVFGGG